jgi:hypothetical protein
VNFTCFDELSNSQGKENFSLHGISEILKKIVKECNFRSLNTMQGLHGKEWKQIKSIIPRFYTHPGSIRNLLGSKGWTYMLYRTPEHC